MFIGRVLELCAQVALLMSQSVDVPNINLRNNADSHSMGIFWDIVVKEMGP